MHKKITMLAATALIAFRLWAAPSWRSLPRSCQEWQHSKIGNVGETLRNAGTSYKVTKVRTTKTLGDPEFLGERANGTFVIVNLAITNHKDETKTFTIAPSSSRLRDGNKYETSTDAEMSLDKSLMLEDIQPDLTTRGQLAFDLPEKKLNGAKLVIEDFWGQGKVKVNLGL